MLIKEDINGVHWISSSSIAHGKSPCLFGSKNHKSF